MTPPVIAENGDKEVIGLCHEQLLSLPSVSQPLKGGLSAWWQGHWLTQQLVHYADFSILLLNVLIWSPG
jgi:hypothetical protein